MGHENSGKPKGLRKGKAIKDDASALLAAWSERVKAAREGLQEARRTKDTGAIQRALGALLAAIDGTEPAQRARVRNRDGLTEAWMPTFLEALWEIPDVSAAATRAGIDRDVAYYWRPKCEAFDISWKLALSRSLDAYQARLHNTAMGYMNPSSTQHDALKFSLISHLPETFNPKQRQEPDDKKFDFEKSAEAFQRAIAGDEKA